MKRNKFSLSHYKLATMDMGWLYPISCYEVLPGDTVQQNCSALIRCTPLATPPMHPVTIKVHHWFVPNRLIWEDWEDFITGGSYGSTPPERPYGLTPTGWEAGSLADFLGLPLNCVNQAYSILPFRAYNLIFNENYRDQDLTPEVTIEMGSGIDATTSMVIQEANWQRDYFTGARPWAQKSPDISIPMQITAPVRGNAPMQLKNPASGNLSQLNSVSQAVRTPTIADATGLWLANGSDAGGSGLEAYTYNAGGTINQLREAFALQRYAEARARYGSRYVEYLRYIGVNPSDARLQRPEYLGGGKTTMQFSEVLQTGPSSTDGSQTVGELFGHGIASMRSNRYRRFFEEHGLVMTLMSVMPAPMYGQAQHKMWNRLTKEDYYQRELEHIGQQEVMQMELYCNPANFESSYNTVFGYADRYSEYKSIPNTTANGFRPGAAYDDWNFARGFTQAPVLNDSFIRGPVTKRPFADQTDNTLLVMAKHSIQACRMLAKTPSNYVR